MVLSEKNLDSVLAAWAGHKSDHFTQGWAIKGRPVKSCGLALLKKPQAMELKIHELVCNRLVLKLIILCCPLVMLYITRCPWQK